MASSTRDTTDCPACGSACRMPHPAPPAWRARCARCDRRFDVVPRSVGEGPFREQPAADVLALQPSPTVSLVDRSEGFHLRDVIITPKARPRARAAIGMVLALGLVGLAAELFVQATFASVAGGIVSLVMAALTSAGAAYALVGREQVVIESGMLSRRQGVGSLAVRSRLPLEGIQSISVRPEGPWTLDPDGSGAAVEIDLVQFGHRATSPWRIAAGLDWTRAELEWLAEYLETGVALARRDVARPGERGH